MEVSSATLPDYFEREAFIAISILFKNWNRYLQDNFTRRNETDFEKKKKNG